MTRIASIAEKRQRACKTLLGKARKIADAQGITTASLQQLTALLVALAAKGDALFPLADFAMPEAQGRNHMLDPAADDGLGLYLTISLPGKEAAPHDHGIWCVNAAVAGAERHRFYRRTDDGSRPGFATVEQTGMVTVAPGTGMAMADHDIHATDVLGEVPFVGLALYGYALTRFPSLAWYHPEFSAVRTTPSRRVTSTVAAVA
jgi:predicted metal-dependent enzyme (double-stranded beta helix superfamily)